LRDPFFYSFLSNLSSELSLQLHIPFILLLGTEAKY
jgi:hypothetical protein